MENLSLIQDVDVDSDPVQDNATSSAINLVLVSEATNKDDQKLVIDSKQTTIRFADIYIYHDQNCRNALDKTGQVYVTSLLNQLKMGNSLKTLTLSPFELNQGDVQLKVLDGHHTYEAIAAFIQHLSDLGTKEVTISGVTYTNDPKTTLLPVAIEAIDEYSQEIYKISSQNSRKNSDLETVEFILSTLKKHEIPLSKLANDLGKSESTLKNLLILDHCLDSTKELIRNGEIKGSRVVQLMRFSFKNHGVDLRKKGAVIPQEVLEYIDMLVSKEVDLNKADTTPTPPPEKTKGAATGTGADDGTGDGAGGDGAGGDGADDGTGDGTGGDGADDGTGDGAGADDGDGKEKKKSTKNALKPQTLTQKKVEQITNLFDSIDNCPVEFDEETKLSSIKIDSSVLESISALRQELEAMIAHNNQVDVILNGKK